MQYSYLHSNVPYVESADFRNYLLIVVSFTIAMFIFGVLGDSTAQVSGSGAGGLAWQLGGSAAGFVIFYLVLSRGLSPVWSLNVFLDDENGNRFGSSALIEVRGNPRQEMETSSGNLTFAYLPKGVPAQLAIVSDAYSFDMEKIVENECLKKARNSIEVRSDCNNITLVLKRREIPFAGIKEFSTRGSTNLSWRLSDAMVDLIGRIRQWSGSRGIVADVMYGQKANDLKGYDWRLDVDYVVDASLCRILADYRDQFNRQHPEANLRFVVGIKTLYVLSADDAGGEDDQCK